LDHDNCPLDLDKLVAALKAPRRQDRSELDEIKQRINAANERMKAAYKAAGDAYATDPDYRKAAEGHKAGWEAWREWHYKQSDAYWTLLYSIRAHHRGRIHRKRERCGDGSVIEHTLESQAAFIEEQGGKLLREFECKVSQEAA